MNPPDSRNALGALVALPAAAAALHLRQRRTWSERRASSSVLIRRAHRSPRPIPRGGRLAALRALATTALALLACALAASPAVGDRDTLSALTEFPAPFSKHVHN